MSENWKIQISFKYGRMADMVNVRADTVEELMELMNGISENSTFLVASAEDFQAKATVAAVFPGTVDAGKDDTDVCAHGVAWKSQSGVKNGKAWSGKFCQVENDPKLPKCKAKWDN